jgi:alpha-L-rhamnosidase
MNHFMLGHLMEWHFAYVAGIRQRPGSIGWRRVLIAPNPGSFEHASASFNSPRGRIEVRWQQTPEAFDMTVTIPRGVDAEVVLPNGNKQSVKPGTATLHSERI